MLWKKIKVLFGTFVFAFVSIGFAGQAGPQTMTFDGRAFGNSDATVPMLDIISTKIQILTPAQDCVLYEETQSIDTRSTNGYFTIQIGSVVSDPKRTGYDSNLAMNTVFANSSSGVAGKRVTDGSACTYNSSAGDKRYVRVQMTPSSDGVTRNISPNMLLDSVPNAMVAETVQGLAPADFVQINNSGSSVLSQANAENIFSSTNYPNLLNLLSVAPTSYVRTGSNGSASLPSVAGNPGSGLTAGQIWYDSTANVIKYYDGTTKTLGTSTGLTSVGLTLPSIFTVSGSPLTANGSIAATLANQNANLVFAGPSSGGAGAPTFRALAAADLPTTGATGAYVNGGNSFGAAAVLGTNDANTFAIKTNGTARMSFDTSGNVGIGTIAPSAPLNIETNTASFDFPVVARNLSANNGAWAGLSARNNANRALEFIYTSTNASNLLYTGGPTGEQGAIGTSGSYPLSFATNNTSRLTITGAGDIGIGTSSPLAKLDIVSQGAGIQNALFLGNPNATTGSGAQLLFDMSTAHNLPQAGISGIRTNSPVGLDGDLTFSTRNSSLSEKMRITSTGNVGIGTTSPSYPLQVAGIASANSFYVPPGGSSSNFNNALNVFVYNSGTYNPSGTLLSGAVSIAGVNTNGANGTASFVKVESRNSANAYQASYFGSVSVSGGQTPVTVIGQASGAGTYVERMRIDTAGNVGIGTAAPASKLDIRAADNTTIATFGNTANAGTTEIRSRGANQSQYLAFKRPDGAYDQLAIFPPTGADAYGRFNSSGPISMEADSQGFGMSDTSTYGMFNFSSVGGLTSSSGQHTFFYFKPKIDQSGTAGYNGLYVDVEETSVGSGSKNILNLATSGTSRMVVQSSGSVGIGVTDPTSKLQVAGDITPDTTATKNLGSSSLRWNNIYLSNAPDVSSDARLKKDVQTSDLGLDFINSLRPVSWTWKDPNQGTTQHYGVIAQETESAIAKAKGNDSRNVIVTHNEETDSYSVRYTELISPLIKAMQEIYSKIVGVDREIASIKVENKALKARADRAEQENAVIKAYLCSKDPKAAICR